MTVSAYCKSSDSLFGTFGIRWIGICAMLFCSPLPAAEPPDSLQFHGFATQDYTWTSDNNFFGNSSNGGTLQATELGINVSWLPINNLQLSGQLLYRRAGKTDPGELKLDYGLLDYSFVSDDVNRWGVRLGRVKNPSGFYNETRDVAFTRPSILLPQSIYPDEVRSLALSSDGVLFYGEHRSDFGDFSLQAGTGYPQAVDRELEPIVFTTMVPGGFDHKLSYISRFLYESNDGQWRAALSYFQADLDFEPGVAQNPPFGSLRIEPWIFSLQYNAERWSVTSEYSLRKVRSKGFGLPGANTQTAEAYYIQGTYRFLPDWEMLLRYDVVYTDKDDKSGGKFAATDPYRRPAYSRFAKDWTLGLKWSVNPQLSLRAEYHWVNGTSWLSELDNPHPDKTKQYWDMLLFQLSYRF